MLCNFDFESCFIQRRHVIKTLKWIYKACEAPKIQTSLDTLHKRGGIALQLGLTQLMGQATAAAAKEVGLGDDKCIYIYIYI